MGAVTRAAAVCHCYGRVTDPPHSSQKKELQAISVLRSNFLHVSISGCQVTVPLKEGAVQLHTGCLTASVSCCPGAWCGPYTARGEEQDGSTAGGLPPTSLLLKEGHWPSVWPQLDARLVAQRLSLHSTAFAA